MTKIHLILSGLILSTGFFAACQPNPGSSYGSVSGSGSERMVGILDEIRVAAEESPMPYFHLNEARAGVMRDRMESASPEEWPAAAFALAHELLLAGRSREAIDLLLTIQMMLPHPGLVTAETVPFYDLLALAYMRLGEDENCVEHHGERSCILPISGDGVHIRTDGARGAATIYERLLRTNPADLQTLWLYNLAMMTLGEWPDAVHERTLIRQMAGVDIPFRGFVDVATSTGSAVEAMSGGVSADDFNGNGLIDLFVTGYGLDEQARLLINDGSGRFVDRTDEAGLTGIAGGLNTVHADFDNDGHTDILVLRGAWLGSHGEHPNSLLRNLGDGTFEDVTFDSGLGQFHPSLTAAWGDFNGDGHLDLFVGNESGRSFDIFSGRTATVPPRRSHLFMNNGDGTFEEVSSEVGVDLDAFVRGAVWCDINNNGRPDLYVSILGGENKLFVNEGETVDGGWRFAERAADAGVTRPFFSFPVGCFDYDQDGHLDLLVLPYDVRRFDRVAADAASEALDLEAPSEKARLFRNNGDGTFTDVAAEAGLDMPLYAMGFNIGDLDNDGFPDFYVGTGAPDLRSLVPNRMFRNRGDGTFEDVSRAGGFGHIQKGHGIAFADFRNRGLVDVYTNVGGAVEGDRFRNVLFANPGFDNRWIGLQLEGHQANRSAIGARIHIRVRNNDGHHRDVFRTVSTGGSFGAAPLRQIIGLGDAAEILELDVRWPDGAGTSGTWTDLEMDRYYRIRQGEVDAEQLQIPSFDYRPRDSLATPLVAGS